MAQKNKKPTKSQKNTKASSNKAPAKTEKPKRYKSFRLQKRISHESQTKLSNSFRVTRDSWGLVRTHWKTFAGITAVYFLVATVIVWGFASATNLGEIRELAVLEGRGAFSASIESFSALVQSLGTVPSEAGGAYGTLLIVIVSLAVIWTLRQIMAGEEVSVKDAFYKGMYPLVPFLMVLLVFILQLFPVAFAGFIYSIAFNGTAVVLPAEQIMWGVLGGMFTFLSLYFISSSIFAMYIVSLPDMHPITALRSARELVRFRRWEVMRKLLFLPLFMLVVAALVMLPVIALLPFAAEWTFRLLSIVGLIYFHTYVYSLYRELL